MDEAKLVLRIARQCSEFECVFQTELRAKEAEVVEKLNGFGVVHLNKLNHHPHMVGTRCRASFNFKAAQQRRPTSFESWEVVIVQR